MRSIHCPLRSVNAARFLASAITSVSNRPIWLVDAACPVTAQPGNDTDCGRRTRLGFLCGREAGRLVRPESRRQAMARVAGHLSVEDLEAGFRSARDPTATRHVQVIWLLARGHTIADVAA